ncbi:MAG: hypothetical protein ACJAUQ_000269 [Maribacter sp.]|jgi:hypothetical protein
MNLKFYFTACIAAVFFSCQKDQVMDLEVFDVKQEMLLNKPEVSGPETLNAPVKNSVLGM